MNGTVRAEKHSPIKSNSPTYSSGLQVAHFTIRNNNSIVFNAIGISEMCLFNLGNVVATPAALEFCNENNINPADLIKRHQGGDFGDLDASDTKANVHAIQNDLRIFSSYKVNGGKLWVITEASREVTTMLLPADY